MSAIIFVLFWVACGTAAAGIAYADFQRTFTLSADKSRRDDAGFALVVGFFGPVGLLVIFFLSGFAKHGWLFPGSKP